MTRILFVSNGNGERAIADRIAGEVRRLSGCTLDHLSLVGEGSADNMHEVGPRRVMPSGGLVAMGNVRNIARDVRAGLAALTLAQVRFLRQSRGRYALAVSVGDAYALALARACRAPVVFVGTAKSVYVAPYGPMEERLLRSARAVFVRDDATAQRLRAHDVAAEFVGNAIVDLYAQEAAAGPDPFSIDGEPCIALLPGSRTGAYADAVFLGNVVRELAPSRPKLSAALSIAPNLDVARFASAFAQNEWDVREVPRGFCLYDGERERVRAWRGPAGALFSRAALALGQAGTANEAAAAAGIPIVAFSIGEERNGGWYRRRQQALLDGALTVLPGDVAAASAGVGALLEDASRRAHMGLIGRQRMGPPGGSQAIADRIASLAA